MTLMKKANFAATPWQVGGTYAHKTVLQNAHGQSIASGGNNRAVNGIQLESSLTLAAAAPKLLRALELALAESDGVDINENWQELARAAITNSYLMVPA